ncbi:hypothetical protein [Emticicia fluvialis]|uniref:hypothetical protein n=1 Tax=Emticicia fluvialis TaxID=2974474 RepID=UPI0021660F75|nr:hypothetical protein [Emticicia fluvialis]
MKRIASIGLLLLLLNHLFGLTIAMLFFEDNYQTHSNTIIEDKWKVIKLPASNKTISIDNTIKEGLIRSGNEFYNVMHEYQENDTLYVILKSNQNAQERFDELTSLVQGMFDADTPQSPLSKAMKLYGGLLKVYLSNDTDLQLIKPCLVSNPSQPFKEPEKRYASVINLLHTPPPELT